MLHSCVCSARGDTGTVPLIIRYPDVATQADSDWTITLHSVTAVCRNM